jgi:hypothetical protein
MTDFDYKKYSLKQLKEWVDNAVLSSEASPQEIYDVIKETVDENYYYFKYYTGRCYELLALLNGNGAGHIQAYDDYVKEVLSEREYYEGKDDGMRPWGHSDLEYQVANESLSCDKDDTSPECQGAWNDFWEENYYPEETKELRKEIEKVREEGGYEWTPVQDKVTKWVLPVQQKNEEGVDELYVTLPDDLLEQVGWKEGDTVEYVPSENGFYVMRKI